MINHGMVASSGWPAPAWNLQKNVIPQIEAVISQRFDLWKPLRFGDSTVLAIPKMAKPSPSHHEFLVTITKNGSYGSGFPTSFNIQLFQRISTWASEPGTVRRFAFCFTTRRMILHKHTCHVLRSQIQDSRIETLSQSCFHTFQKDAVDHLNIWHRKWFITPISYIYICMYIYIYICVYIYITGNPEKN